MSIKIAIIDSGINPGHPHVGGIAGGACFAVNAPAGHDLIDRLGHGTAVAGAIREKAPGAALYAVKIFDDRLSTKFATLLNAINWCVENEMDVLNLSVATQKPLPEIDAIVVSPAMVHADPNCPRDRYYYRDGIFYASPYPRPIPGVPVERNLQGASFAGAKMTGFVARALAGLPQKIPRAAILPVLIAQAASIP